MSALPAQADIKVVQESPALLPVPALGCVCACVCVSARNHTDDDESAFDGVKNFIPLILPHCASLCLQDVLRGSFRYCLQFSHLPEPETGALPPGHTRYERALPPVRCRLRFPRADPRTDGRTGDHR